MPAGGESAFRAKRFSRRDRGPRSVPWGSGPVLPKVPRAGWALRGFASLALRWIHPLVQFAPPEQSIRFALPFLPSGLMAGSPVRLRPHFFFGFSLRDARACGALFPVPEYYLLRASWLLESRW